MHPFMILIFLAIFSEQVLTPTPEINSQNIANFAPVAQIDFATDPLQSGWFALSDDGHLATVAMPDSMLVEFSITGEQRVLYQQKDFVTGTYRGDTFIGLHAPVDGYLLIDNAMPVSEFLYEYDADTPAYPQDLFVTDETLFVEHQPMGMDNEAFVSLNARDGDSISFIEYAPSEDESAVVRIGRIPAPYAVTSSQTGDVTLWNWTTGAALKTVNNGLDEPSVFGNINTSASHLVWRDNASETLYLLDFETGENKTIAALNGDYVQWFFLSNDANVIIGVNIGFVPNVVAWDVATGEFLELGNYLPCERPQPDMARLSADGTTLVIGCDVGLQFWRIGAGK